MPAGQKQKFTDAQLIAALRRTGCIAVRAAEELGVGRSTVCQRINREGRRGEKIREFIHDYEEGLKDSAEANVAVAIKASDLPTTRWFLERKGKDRGYGNSTSLKLDDDQIEAMLRVASPETLRKLAEGA